MGNSKIVYEDKVLIDLEGDTVAPETLAEGATAHDANGDPIVGTMPTDVVRHGGPQTLTDAEKAQARDNIDALSAGDVNTVLRQAKESGAFDGKDGVDGAPGKDGADGQRGTGILKVAMAPSSCITAIGSYTPKYRIALSIVKTQSGKDEVLIGDLIQYNYYQYQVDYLDDTYAYISASRVSIRGATGADGAAGATGPQGPAGPAGSDATVTATNIKSALGYTPADATEVSGLKTSVSEGKALIASAVTDKGVATADDATFAVMAANIGQIETGVDCTSGFLSLSVVDVVVGANTVADGAQAIDYLEGLVNGRVCAIALLDNPTTNNQLVSAPGSTAKTESGYDNYRVGYRYNTSGVRLREIALYADYNAVLKQGSRYKVWVADINTTDYTPY